MKIEVTNKGLRIYPANQAEDAAITDFQEDTAFQVDGARHSRAYIMGRWDGREVLVNYDHGCWRSPVGLLDEAFEAFGECEVVDARSKPGASLEMRLDKSIIPKLRPYQSEAVDAILDDCGVLTGKGLVRLPTRSGKTVIAAKAICRLGHRSLFVVNSDMLLRQTVAFFRKVMIFKAPPPDGIAEVGQYGGGENEVGWVTVASVQSITSRFKSSIVKKLLDDVDVVFFDECHHLEGALWRKAMTKADAMYKIGLSATIYVDRAGPLARGSIWLIGATGPIVYSLEPSDLIEAGWLCRPVITFVTTPELDWDIDGTFAQQYRAGIAEHPGRNAVIAKIAREEVGRGNRVLITVRLLDHVKLLEAELKNAGLRIAVVTGKTAASKRRELTDAVRKRELDVLLGTVFGEAVDLPFLECVIVADAGVSPVLTMQRLRNLTPVGEDDRPLLEPMATAARVPVYDFADFGSSTLRRHSLQRLKTYKAHRSFQIRWRRE